MCKNQNTELLTLIFDLEFSKSLLLLCIIQCLKKNTSHILNPLDRVGGLVGIGPSFMKISSQLFNSMQLGGKIRQQ